MKVLLADDHAVVRRGLRELLAEAFPEAAFTEATSGEDATALAAREPFDLVLLDLSMPRRGGMPALKALRVMRPSLPVIILSQHAGDEYAAGVLQAGARGFVSKGRAPEELVPAVRAVLAGSTFVSGL